MECIEEALELPNQSSESSYGCWLSFPILHSPIPSSRLTPTLSQGPQRPLPFLLPGQREENSTSQIVSMTTTYFHHMLLLTFNPSHSRQCTAIYGEDVFRRIHGYLREARSHSVPHEDEAGVVAGLRALTSNTRDCFLVDQLVFLERQL